MKSKSEFLAEYRSANPTTYVYLVLSFAFEIMGGILIIFGVLKCNGSYSTKEKEMFLLLAVFGGFLFVIGLIFTKLFHSCEHRAIIEWEKYKLSKSSGKTIKDKHKEECVQEKLDLDACDFYEEKSGKYQWICPECRRINVSESDIDTCICGYSPID